MKHHVMNAWVGVKIDVYSYLTSSCWRKWSP